MTDKKPNTGTMNENDRSENPKRPHWRGSVDVDGAAYWISAWERDGPKGKFLSLAVERKDARGGRPNAPLVPAAADGDDVPF